MKTSTINYFISENYIPHWTLEDAYREIFQNFKDFGEYNLEITNINNEKDLILISNSFNPETLDLLIIGESNKTSTNLGKYGEGLKMAALVILRNNGNFIIKTEKFKATFELVINEQTTSKTLGVKIEEYGVIIPYHEYNRFIIEIETTIGTFKTYSDTIIKPIDIIHTRENYGSIVNKSKGDFYVGDLFVCNIPKLNYAYNLYPRVCNLDRDRKVPSDWDVQYNIGKIQETFEEFDKVGKSNDVSYSRIPINIIESYKPTVSGNKIIFTTKIKNDKGEEKEVEVSNYFNNQLIEHSYFSKIVFKLKTFITSSLGIDTLALQFRNKYCNSSESIRDFNILMYRLGIVMPDTEELPF